MYSVVSISLHVLHDGGSLMPIFYGLQIYVILCNWRTVNKVPYYTKKK